MNTPRVTVVGAGIAGLTSAVHLAERGYQVDVLARDFPLETTSAVAGALWYPYRAAPPEPVLAWSAQTFEVYQNDAVDPDSGVRLVDGLELRRSPSTPWFVSALPESAGFTHYNALPEGYLDGWQMRLPIIRPARYLSLLVKRLHDSGGTLTRMALSGLPDDSLVINCTGLAAKSLVDDPDVTPVAGQVVRVEKVPGIDTWLLDQSDEERPIYVVPRTTDVIVGGTALVGSFERRPTDATEADILARASRLVPQLTGARVLGRAAGLRPSRSAIRLEVERRPAGGTIIHNYGHGGCGWTLAWGCAAEVAALVQQTIAEAA